VKKFHGVGPATAERMHRLGLHTGADLRAQTIEFLTAHFGKSGPYYHGIARGIDHRPVRANRERKSVGSESTFSADLREREDLEAALAPLIDKVWRDCETHGLAGRTVTLKVKFADFQQITRARSHATPVASRPALERPVLELLQALLPAPKGIRLLGVTVSSFAEPGETAPVQFALPL
jgi:DNA polymerase-4